MTKGKINSLLKDADRYLMCTHRASGTQYTLDTGAAVTAAQAARLTADRLAAAQGDLFLHPSEDGLFPGHSQTWRVR